LLPSPGAAAALCSTFPSSSKVLKFAGQQAASRSRQYRRPGTHSPALPLASYRPPAARTRSEAPSPLRGVGPCLQRRRWALAAASLSTPPTSLDRLFFSWPSPAAECVSLLAARSRPIVRPCCPAAPGLLPCPQIATFPSLLYPLLPPTVSAHRHLPVVALSTVVARPLDIKSC
jgi:hypothetical protein